MKGLSKFGTVNENGEDLTEPKDPKLTLLLHLPSLFLQAADFPRETIPSTFASQPANAIFPVCFTIF